MKEIFTHPLICYWRQIVIIGLDLAGVESRPTGFCSLIGMKVETSLVYSDIDILAKIRESNPEVVAIDAPLSLPPGRKSLEERTGPHLRECDKELLKKGIRFFPLTLGPMRKLTSRGINLRRILEGEKFVVIETYPGGAQDVLGIQRKQKGLEKLKTGLENLDIIGLSVQMSDHELDAVTCAYVGKLFFEGKNVTYGALNEGIVMPKGEKISKKPSETIQ
jgi:predicted nuclease with RNAse H fold